MAKTGLPVASTVPEIERSPRIGNEPDKTAKNNCARKGKSIDRVNDKVAIVTSGAGGLGSTEALLLAE
jgi:hypothetical protein